MALEAWGELVVDIFTWLRGWSPWHLRREIKAYQQHLAAMDDTMAGYAISIKASRTLLEKYERAERARVQAQMIELVDVIRMPDGPNRGDLLDELRRDEGLDGHLAELMDEEGGSPGS